jgi:hypothetical protein
MEKRSRRRTRDLVTQAASQGLSQNKIACARISMMARSTYAPSKGRIQMRKTTPSICSHSACTARPVHTVGLGLFNRDFRFCPVNGHRRSVGTTSEKCHHRKSVDFSITSSVHSFLAQASRLYKQEAREVLD